MLCAALRKHPRCEDDLTHKLVEIIRANAGLKRMVANGSPQHILNEYVQLLQVGRRRRRAVGGANDQGWLRMRAAGDGWRR